MVLYSVPQMSKRCGLSPWYLRQMIREGKLAVVQRKARGTIYISDQAIEQMVLEQQETQHATWRRASPTARSLFKELTGRSWV